MRYRILNLHDTEGHWTATIEGVNDKGETVGIYQVDRKSGSWQIGPAEHRCDVLPGIAADLQAQVRKIERNRKPVEA